MRRVVRRWLRRLGTRLGPREAGSAVVEFTFLAVLMLIPLIYLVMMVARVQAGAYAVSLAARESGRAYVTATSLAEAAARAEAALGSDRAREVVVYCSGFD